VASGKLAGWAVGVVVLSCGLPEQGGDAGGERVAADAGEVLAEKVSCPPGMAGRRGGDHFDVVAFPGHLLVAGTLARCSGDGVQVGDGEPEGRVSLDGEPQCRGSGGRVGGALRLPVPRSGPRRCGDRAAVDINRGPGSGQVVRLAGVLVTRWLHECHVAQVH
jgi:hypothetical protein